MKIYFVKFAKNYCGMYIPEKDEILIDINKNENPAITYLHEMIHKSFPYLSEPTVEAMESYIWDSLTTRQKYNLFRELFSHPYRRYDGKKQAG